MQRRTRVPARNSNGGKDGVEGRGNGQGHGSFLSSIFSHLAEARAELEDLASSVKNDEKYRGKVREREEQAVRVRLERCIALVKGVIRGAPGLMTPAHSNRGMGLLWEVSITVKQTGQRYPGSSSGIGGGMTGSISTGIGSTSVSAMASSGVGQLPPPPPPGETYALEVHPLETVGSLRERVAVTNGLGSRPECLRIGCQKPLSVDTQTVAEAGITDGTSIWTIAISGQVPGVVLGSQAERHRIDEVERRKGGQVHDGDVIAGQSGPFDELFRLLECAHGMAKVCVCEREK